MPAKIDDFKDKLDGEVFLPIANTDNKYYISNMGRVVSCSRVHTEPTILKCRSFINGHPFVPIYIKGKQKLFSLRRLVYMTFHNTKHRVPYIYADDGTTTTVDLDKLYSVKSKEHTSLMGQKSAKDKCVKIQCIDTGQIFSSITEATKYYDVSGHIVRNRIIRDDGTCNFKNIYNNDIFTFRFKVIEPAKKINCPCIHIICNETGEEYKSIAEVSRDLEVSIKSINRAVNKGGSVKTRYGEFTFRKADTNHD